MFVCILADARSGCKVSPQLGSVIRSRMSFGAAGLDIAQFGKTNVVSVKLEYNFMCCLLYPADTSRS